MSNAGLTPRRAPRRAQTVLLSVFVCLIACGWFVGARIQRAVRQRTAVEAITKEGGWVIYDYQMAAERNPPKEPPAWLRNLFGVDFLAGVRNATVTSDAAGEHLTGLPELEILDLDGSRVTDAVIKHVRNLGQMKELEIRNTQVTDKGVAELRLALPDCHIVH